jgi:hypothetical protein
VFLSPLQGILWFVEVRRVDRQPDDVVAVPGDFLVGFLHQIIFVMPLDEGTLRARPLQHDNFAAIVFQGVFFVDRIWKCEIWGLLPDFGANLCSAIFFLCLLGSLFVLGGNVGAYE